MTKAQIEVLGLLKKNGPMRTSATTHHEVVSGASANALKRLGFVSGRYVDEEYTVTITPAGVEAYEAASTKQ
jgi:hypothetical protein